MKMREVKNDRQIFKQNIEVFAADLTTNIKTDLFQTKDAQNGSKTVLMVKIHSNRNFIFIGQ